MGGIVLHVPSCSIMFPLLEAFQASDFNLHAHPLCHLEFIVDTALVQYQKCRCNAKSGLSIRDAKK